MRAVTENFSELARIDDEEEEADDEEWYDTGAVDVEQEDEAGDGLQDGAGRDLDALLSPTVGITNMGRSRGSLKRTSTAGPRFFSNAVQFAEVGRGSVAGGVVKEKMSLLNVEVRRKSFLQRQLEVMTRSAEDARKQAESEREELLSVLAEAGGGSVIRGWRLELDLDLEVGFTKFCSVCQRLGFCGDTEALFGNDGDNSSLTLDEVAPEHFKILSDFQHWVSIAFGSPMHFFFVLDSQRKGKLFREQFAKACQENGFDGTIRACNEAFDSCDISSAGVILPEDVLFLEKDPTKRANYVKRLQLATVTDWLSDAAQQYVQKTTRIRNAGREEAATLWKSRRAPRPWMAATFDQMPVVRYTQKRDKDRRQHVMEAEAKRIFLDHLVKAHGQEVRAMRRALDVDGTFSFAAQTLRRYCRQVDLAVNLPALWRSLDRNGSQRIELQDLCSFHARALAMFYVWARGTCYSRRTCAQLWDSAQARNIRGAVKLDGSYTSDKRMTTAQFVKLLKVCKCPLAQQPEERTSLLTSLDFQGCGFIYRSDLEWLDKWDPPAWLVAEPSTEAWEGLKALLESHYGHLLKAWRHALDLDNSNLTCWSEFRDACKRVKFKGDVAGAWRALDLDLSGTITMREYDPSSAQLLESFKEWAEATFGSVFLCFKALDTDKSGTVTFQELKRACHKMKWQGDVRLLFEALDVDGKRDKQGEGVGRRSISLEEISFLDTWVIEGRGTSDREGTPMTQTSSKRTSSAPSRAVSRDGVRQAFPPRTTMVSTSKLAPPVANVDYLELSDTATESRSRIFDITPSNGASRMGSPSGSLMLMLTPSSAMSGSYSTLEPILKSRNKKHNSSTSAPSTASMSTSQDHAGRAALVGLGMGRLVGVPEPIARDKCVDPYWRQSRTLKKRPLYDEGSFRQDEIGDRRSKLLTKKKAGTLPKHASMPSIPTPWICHFDNCACCFH